MKKNKEKKEQINHVSTIKNNNNPNYTAHFSCFLLPPNGVKNITLPNTKKWFKHFAILIKRKTHANVNP